MLAADHYLYFAFFILYVLDLGFFPFLLFPFPAGFVRIKRSVRYTMAPSKKKASSSFSLSVAAAKKRSDPMGKKKSVSAIDDIFSAGMEQKRAKEASEKKKQQEKANAEAKERRKRARIKTKEREASAKNSQNAKPSRYDEAGLAIYTEESLGIGQGGGTELCPFDCQCCF